MGGTVDPSDPLGVGVAAPEAPQRLADLPLASPASSPLARSSTTSSGARRRKSALPSFASILAISPSSLGLLVRAARLSAARSTMPSSGSAATSPRTMSWTELLRRRSAEGDLRQRREAPHRLAPALDPRAHSARAAPERAGSARRPARSSPSARSGSRRRGRRPSRSPPRRARRRALEAGQGASARTPVAAPPPRP